jgi:hypothetical protein
VDEARLFIEVKSFSEVGRYTAHLLLRQVLQRNAVTGAGLVSSRLGQCLQTYGIGEARPSEAVHDYVAHLGCEDSLRQNLVV